MTMMTINTNNGAAGGRQNHRLSSSSSSLHDVISQYRVVYYDSAHNKTTHNGKADHTFPIVLGVVAIVLFLLRCIYYDWHRNDDAEQPADQAAVAGRPPPVSREGAGLADRAAAPSTTVVELVPSGDQPPVLVSTYRKAYGLGEASSCGVCLADLTDGEALRVLPACMHYFHTVCVNEWLRRHATCPLCRATLVVAPADNA